MRASIVSYSIYRSSLRKSRYYGLQTTVQCTASSAMESEFLEPNFLRRAAHTRSGEKDCSVPVYVLRRRAALLAGIPWSIKQNKNGIISVTSPLLFYASVQS